MHLLRAGVLRMLIVVAIASTELVVLVVRPASWEIAAFTLAALLIALQTGRRSRTNARYGSCDDANAPALRLPRVRITVRRMMIAVALAAIVLWPVHNWRQRPYYEEMTKVHGLMSYLRANEAALLAKCWRQVVLGSRLGVGATWDEIGGEVDNLTSQPLFE